MHEFVGVKVQACLARYYELLAPIQSKTKLTINSALETLIFLIHMQIMTFTANPSASLTRTAKWLPGWTGNADVFLSDNFGLLHILL